MGDLAGSQIRHLFLEIITSNFRSRTWELRSSIAFYVSQMPVTNVRSVKSITEVNRKYNFICSHSLFVSAQFVFAYISACMTVLSEMSSYICRYVAFFILYLHGVQRWRSYRGIKHYLNARRGQTEYLECIKHLGRQQGLPTPTLSPSGLELRPFGSRT